MTLTSRTPSTHRDGSTGAGTSRQKRRLLRDFRLWALVPFLAFLTAFAAVPVLQLIWMAFGRLHVDFGDFSWAYAGFANFRKIAYDPVAVDSIFNTLVFIGATVPLTVLLGTALALLVDRSVVFVGLARNVLLWPAVLAPVVVSLIWLLILSPNIGVLNKILESLGLPSQGWLGSEDAAMDVIIALDVWHWTPVVFLLVYTALRAIDRELLEAASVDGATDWKAYWHVILPLLYPAIITAGALRLINGVKAFDEMYLLTKGGPGTATTLVSLHIRNVFFDHLDLGYGAAFSVAVVVVTVLAVVVFVGTRRLVRLGGRPA